MKRLLMANKDLIIIGSISLAVCFLIAFVAQNTINEKKEEITKLTKRLSEEVDESDELRKNWKKCLSSERFYRSVIGFKDDDLRDCEEVISDLELKCHEDEYKSMSKELEEILKIKDAKAWREKKEKRKHEKPKTSN